MAAGCHISTAMIMTASIATIIIVISTSEVVVIHRGFLVIIFFLPRARILAILLVLVKTEPYIMEKDRPGNILVM